MIPYERVKVGIPIDLKLFILGTLISRFGFWLVHIFALVYMWVLRSPFYGLTLAYAISTIVRFLIQVPVGLSLSKFSPRSLTILGNILYIPATLVFLTSTTWTQYLLGYVFLGLAGGVRSSVQYPFFKLYSKEEHVYSKAYEIFRNSDMILTALAPLVGGIIVTLGSFNHLFIAFLFLSSLSTSIFLLIKPVNITGTTEDIMPINNSVKSIDGRRGNFLYLWEFFSKASFGLFGVLLIFFAIDAVGISFLELGLFETIAGSLLSFLVLSGLSDIFARKIGFMNSIMIGTGAYVLLSMIMLSASNPIHVLFLFAGSDIARSLIDPVLINIVNKEFNDPQIVAGNMLLYGQMGIFTGSIAGSIIFLLSKSLNYLVIFIILCASLGICAFLKATVLYERRMKTRINKG
jgi:MFS family permease